MIRFGVRTLSPENRKTVFTGLLTPPLFLSRYYPSIVAIACNGLQRPSLPLEWHKYLGNAEKATLADSPYTVNIGGSSPSSPTLSLLDRLLARPVSASNAGFLT